MIAFMRIIQFIIIFIFTISEPAFSYDSDALKRNLKIENGDGYKSRVIEIVDGDTIILENNIEVRLVGLQAPKIALSRKNFEEWPLGYEAKDALSDIILGKDVYLYYGGRKMDRYGRTLAHLFKKDGTWVQGEMLKTGMARVYSFADNRSIVDEMLAAEKQARNNKNGIWALNFYKIKPQEISENYLNSFQIISGKIIDVATVKSKTYLNFGDDYRSDFTIVVPWRVKKMFEKLDINLTNLKGKNIFVRGWLKYYNGPSLDLTHPEQLVIQ